MASCPAISDPQSAWPPFCPSLPAAYVFAALFALTTIAHIVQAIMYRKLYSLVAIIGAGMQTGNFILRILSINNVTNKMFYSDFFILMMVAPVWTNAYAYMVMGRMVFNFTPTASVFKVKAWRFGIIFVCLDVGAFFIQLAGLAIVSSSLSNASKGLHIYMLGIAFQQLCIFFFLALAIRLHLKLRLQPSAPDRSKGLLMLYVEYAVVSLISVRIIFRLIEYAHGLNSSIAEHEVYEYIFDSLLMFFAFVLFNIFHPGRMMPGKESNFPSRKERKAMKKAGEVPRGRANDYLLPKYENFTGPDQGRYGRLTTPSPSRPHSHEDDMSYAGRAASPPHGEH